MHFVPVMLFLYELEYLGIEIMMTRGEFYSEIHKHLFNMNKQETPIEQLFFFNYKNYKELPFEISNSVKLKILQNSL